MWFVGMSLSHMVFGRCVLNVIVSKMRKFRKESESKAMTYMKRGTTTWGSGRRQQSKAVRETVNDEMITPDLTTKP